MNATNEITRILSVRLCVRDAHTLPEWATPEFGWYAVETDSRHIWSHWQGLDVPAVYSEANARRAAKLAAEYWGVPVGEVRMPVE